MGITYSSFPFPDIEDLHIPDAHHSKGDHFKCGTNLILQGYRRTDLNLDLDPMVRSVSFGEDKIKTSTTADDDYRHEAALRLQKTYKSFRTRRQLADCAVLAEQKWFVFLRVTYTPTPTKCVLRVTYTPYFD